jgi:hypothetical protein
MGNWRGEGSRQDVVLVNTGDGGNKALPMSGYAVAWVLHLFSFTYADEYFPVAFVWWYKLSDNTGRRDRLTGMWLVECEYRDQDARAPHLAVVHVGSFLHAAHLLPFFGQEEVSRELTSGDTLDTYARFYVNKFADHHSFEIL